MTELNLTEIMEENEDNPGVTITSPSGDWLNDVHLKPYDFAENHQMSPFCFIGGDKNEDGEWAPLTICVVDRRLSRGGEEVVELLKTEAARKWTWRDEDGKPLGKVPTGFVFDLYEAVTVMCAVSATKPEMTIDGPDVPPIRPEGVCRVRCIQNQGAPGETIAGHLAPTDHCRSQVSVNPS
jgi:hypothetical protein